MNKLEKAETVKRDPRSKKPAINLDPVYMEWGTPV